MSRNFEHDNDNINNKNKEKEELGNTLDYYNDEISRKAVGKLFDEPEDELAAGREAGAGRKAEAPRENEDELEERPISNYFYEEARAKKGDDDDGIVRGFETGKISPVNKKRKLDDTLPGSGLDHNDDYKPERDRYRQQFLDDMERDKGRSNSRRPTKEDSEREIGYARRADNRPSGAKSIVKKSSAQYPEEFENAERRYGRSNTLREAEKSRVSSINPPSRASAYMAKPEPSPNDILKLPIFKVIGGVFVLFLIIMIFLIAKINGMNKELKVLREIDPEMIVSLEDYNLVIAEKESLAIQLRDLKTEYNALNLKVAELTEGTAEGETEGTEAGTEGETGVTRKYTVVTGDTLSSISQQFYGNPVNGVDKIKTANNMTNDVLRVGQELIIPE